MYKCSQSDRYFCGALLDWKIHGVDGEREKWISIPTDRIGRRLERVKAKQMIKVCRQTNMLFHIRSICIKSAISQPLHISAPKLAPVVPLSVLNQIFLILSMQTWFQGGMYKVTNYQSIPVIEFIRRTWDKKRFEKFQMSKQNSQ